MKKIITYTLSLALLFGAASCDKIFDNLEGDLTKMSAEDMSGSEAGLDRLMSNLYASLPLGAFSSGEKNTPNATETSGGTGMFGGVPAFWDYSVVRDANTFIKAIDEAKSKGTIDEATYNSYLGEALFVRAYYYFASVRVYGGVPIVTEPLDDKFDGGDNAGLYIPRSTEKDTWDFVLSELDKAADLLPSDRATGKYRATKWSALGLKSRVALWAASVSKYWNQAKIGDNYKAVSEKLAYMDASYADNYYQQCIDACEKIINSGKFALYGAEPADVDQAVANYTNLFLSRQDSEWLFGRSYQNGVSSNTNNFDLQNSPNQVHGSGTGVWKFGCYGVTLDMVDAYDNYGAGFSGVDGTIRTRTDGKEDSYFQTPYSNTDAVKAVSFVKYDSPDGPFKDKDARFLASVIYPGTTFRNITINIQGGLWKSDGTLTIYDDTNPSETVGGVTYYGYGAASESNFSGFYKRGATNDGSWYTTGFGIRKFLDPKQPLSYSQNPWYDIRYAEILLNYCEAEVEKNGTNAGNSKQYLNQIRRRAYFLDQRDATLENVLHERRVELAFEDDYPMTLYRRRAFYNTVRDAASNPEGGRKHALIPIADLHSGTPGYIFVRANFFGDDVDVRPAPYSVNASQYYQAIQNFTINKVTPNPSQE